MTGTCVAERNLRYFVGFVSTTGIHAAQVGLCCLSNFFVGKLKVASEIGLINTVILIYTAIIACMLVGMGGDYFIMIGNGLTLNEKIKYGHRLETTQERRREQREQKRAKFKRNIRNSFCAPLPPSDVFIE